jgi:hypothetical protein
MAAGGPAEWQEQSVWQCTGAWGGCITPPHFRPPRENYISTLTMTLFSIMLLRLIGARLSGESLLALLFACF